jgi:predicted nucleic acid-binding protein
MESALLDTDTISEILRRRNLDVARNTAQYLKQRSEFAFSAITNYEIVRGLALEECDANAVCVPTICSAIRGPTYIGGSF